MAKRLISGVAAQRSPLREAALAAARESLAGGGKWVVLLPFEAAAGDAFFVAAGVVHQFENFSEDFVTWVVFYGPQGGE